MNYSNNSSAAEQLDSQTATTKRQSPKKILSFFSILLAGMFLFGGAANSATTIKFATLAPEGTSWLKTMRDFFKDVSKKTENRIKFKVYPGGIAGDEKDVIRKIRIGQLHSGAFTGVGIGIIAPSVRILDMPFLFKNTDEVDFVLNKFDSKFRKAFEKKGYILLGWSEVGSVNIMANKPIKKPEDLSDVKMWLWEGDPVAHATFKAMKINPIPLSITDVMSSLETGMIDGIYTSPLSAIALQWFTKMKYALSLPITNASGAVLISKRSFNRLSAKDKKIILKAGKKYFRKLTLLSRADNKKSINTLKKHDIIFTDPDSKKTVKIFEAMGKEARKSLVGKLYSEKLMKEVENAIKEYRKSQRTQKLRKSAKNNKKTKAGN
ncbi:MAG: TRAP transporter substrate-binding protein DctP [Elusimicrobiota bacterium]|nr:TRAP transporter substrate-binding protein DctP [Elusimicrobiota bacterium]